MFREEDELDSSLNNSRQSAGQYSHQLWGKFPNIFFSSISKMNNSLLHFKEVKPENHECIVKSILHHHNSPADICSPLKTCRNTQREQMFFMFFSSSGRSDGRIDPSHVSLVPLPLSLLHSSLFWRKWPELDGSFPITSLESKIHLAFL